MVADHSLIVPASQEATFYVLVFIRSGDVYQVNLSQRFAGSFSGDAFSLFRRLRNNFV